MNANKRTSVLCAAAVLGLGTAAPLIAGPYPLEQLQIWLAQAERDLAGIDALISDLEMRVLRQDETVKRLRLMVAANPADGALYSRFADAQRHYDVLLAELNEAKAKRSRVLVHINWIQLQIAAWEESKGGV